jgi:hypothetical protein
MFLQIFSHFGIHVTLCCWLVFPDVSKEGIAFLLLAKETIDFSKTEAIFARNSRLLSSSVEKYLTPIFGQYLSVLFKYYTQIFVVFFC